VLIAGQSDDAIALCLARGDFLLVPGTTREAMKVLLRRYREQAARFGREVPLGTHFYIIFLKCKLLA
jgi:alkanesulfonate monooxygenase SsuD/methylene tetrahydromethanopterin reductase-like flavin-dependent oxidoreductase (luciferase family)